MARKREISTPTRDELGLCGRCRFRIEQGTRRGAVFYRCGLAETDERFMRYPPLPVLGCGGFEPESQDR